MEIDLDDILVTLESIHKNASEDLGHSNTHQANTHHKDINRVIEQLHKDKLCEDLKRVEFDSNKIELLRTVVRKASTLRKKIEVMKITSNSRSGRTNPKEVTEKKYRTFGEWLTTRTVIAILVVIAAIVGLVVDFHDIVGFFDFTAKSNVEQQRLSDTLPSPGGERNDSVKADDSLASEMLLPKSWVEKDSTLVFFQGRLKLTISNISETMQTIDMILLIDTLSPQRLDGIKVDDKQKSFQYSDNTYMIDVYETQLNRALVSIMKIE